MARHRAERPEDALDEETPEPAEDEYDPETEDESDDDEVTDDEAERPADVEKFWSRVHVDPVEIALPRGVGYTLRAYRMSDALVSEAPVDADVPEEPEDDEAARTADTKTGAAKTGAAKVSAAAKPSGRKRVDEDLDEEEAEDEYDEDLDDEDLDDELEDDELEEEEEEGEPEPEEVPVFLTRNRRLLLFRSPEGLAEFIRAGEATDLDVIEEWDALQAGIGPDHVVVNEADRYELDLVVENLRGGHDAWDAELLIKAGELCRDLGHALRIESVVTALSPGSPLDDLDEALRAAEGGRFGAFLARRRLRRVGAQQAALAWRSIIGKISTAVDWRD